MKVTQFTKDALAFRREAKQLEAKGFKRKETDWELLRGWMSVEGGYAILEAKISVCGQYVYTRVGKKA